MAIVQFRDVNELRQRIGQEVAVSDWMTVTQERIDKSRVTQYLAEKLGQI